MRKLKIEFLSYKNDILICHHKNDVLESSIEYYFTTMAPKIIDNLAYNHKISNSVFVRVYRSSGELFLIIPYKNLKLFGCPEYDKNNLKSFRQNINYFKHEYKFLT